MFNVKNLKIIFLALLLAGAMPVLCMADGKKSGTRVNTGAHAVFTNGATLRLVVQYQNPSTNPITINAIKIYRPDGTEVSPNFPAALFPVPPFDLGPYEAKGFPLGVVGINPVDFLPISTMGVFQVHTDWESKRPTNGLKSFSVVITNIPGGEVSKHAVEGFDIKVKKPKDD